MRGVSYSLVPCFVVPWAAIITMVSLNMAKADPMVFPGDRWEQATPQSQGVDPRKLAAAVEFLKDHTGEDGVREVVIVRNGRVIWQGDNIDKVHNIWSCTKSFTSTVLGLLIDDEKCTLDSKAAKFVPELEEHYGDVTLRHFASMTSGYQAVGDEKQSSHGQSKTPFEPLPQPLFTPPGSHYAYWDSAQNQLGHAMTRIAEEPIAELFRRRIATPIGMDPEKWRWGDFGKREGVLVNGGAGNKGKGIAISAREMARFGHLMLNRGRWNDKQLISKAWVAQATATQVPASLPLGHGDKGPGCYGFNWWVNGKQPNGQRKWPKAPPKTFAASGFNNNKCFVIPEWDMVIVRFGLDQKDHLTSDSEWSEFLRRVGEAIVP